MTILGKVHLPQKMLIQKYEIFIMENNVTCTVYCNNSIAAICYTLETCFVSKYIMVNIPHKIITVTITCILWTSCCAARIRTPRLQSTRNDTFLAS
jgi:hypothetical protein